MPTHRKQLSLEGLKPRLSKRPSKIRFWGSSTLYLIQISNPEKWSLDEGEWWLDTEVELESLGLWQGAEFTPHRVGLEIYEGLSCEEADTIDLVLKVGDHLGSDFLGVAY